MSLGSGDRVAFRDECASCGVDLHACRQCLHHDPGAYNECREPNSERVSDRERANRCDWFAPNEAGAGEASSARQTSLDALEDLFKKS